jgi:thiosulfate/3-mercaptopyruvate sulfurtransferase
MPAFLNRWWLAALAAGLLHLLPAGAADRSPHLVDVAWVEAHIGRNDVLVLDASPAKVFATQHLAGAVSADLYSYGVRDVSNAEMERRLQSWGVSRGRKIVIYDQGGSMMATRLFFDLYYHGFPAADLHILDGGLDRWKAAGKPVTADRAPPPAGDFRITALNEDVRVRLPEFLNASGDPQRHALVEALEPTYHFGESKFFDRAGHVPNAIMLPSGDFYNADKTFKSPEEIRTMLAYLGIRPEQQVHTYCGGGVAASVPFFAMKFLLGYPQVRLYKESQLEWLQDERQLPFWTYSAPYLQRDMNWLSGWGSRMMRAYGMSQLSVVDVRSADAYRLGHVPFALHVPDETFRRHVDDTTAIAATLGASGVDARHEAVIVSDGGVTPQAALAFLMLERSGQHKVSILMDSVDEWGLRGLPLAKEATVIGPRRTPQDLVVPATTYNAAARPGVLVKATTGRPGPYPKVFIAAGRQSPGKAPEGGRVVRMPYPDLLKADGTPKAAKDLWTLLDKAGVPRYAEIVCFADDPGEAAVAYYVLKLMGYPDVKVLTG